MYKESEMADELDEMLMTVSEHRVRNTTVLDETYYVLELIKELGVDLHSPFSLLDEHEDASPICFRNGVNSFCNGHFSESLVFFDKALDHKEHLSRRERLVAYFYSGLLLRKDKKSNVAIERLDEALKLDGRHLDAHAIKGCAFMDMGDFSAGLECFDKIVRIQSERHIWMTHFSAAYNKFKPNGHELKALALVKLERWSDAIVCYDALIRQNHARSHAHAGMSYALTELRRYEQAVAHIDSAIAINPANEQFYYKKAFILAKWGDRQRVDELFEHIRRTVKGISFAYHFYAKAHCMLLLKRYSEALENADKAISFNKDYYRCFILKHYALSATGRKDEALALLDQVIALDPNFEFVHVYKAQTLNALKRYDEAFCSYDEALKRSSDGNAKKIILDGKSSVFASLFDYESSIQCCDQILSEIDPQNARALNNKSWYLAKSGRPQLALEFCDKAIENAPQMGTFYHTKGYALAALGKHQEAIEWYNKAIQLDPNDYAEFYKDKAIALAKLGDRDAAIRCFDEAIEREPECTETQQAKHAALKSLNEKSQAKKCHKRNQY